MRTNVNQQKYQIYYDVKVELYCVIKKENVSNIQNVIRKFQNVEKVPDSFYTKGVYLAKKSEDEHNMISDDEIETEIEIKNLRFNK